MPVKKPMIVGKVAQLKHLQELGKTTRNRPSKFDSLNRVRRGDSRSMNDSPIKLLMWAKRMGFVDEMKLALKAGLGNEFRWAYWTGKAENLHVYLGDAIKQGYGKEMRAAIDLESDNVPQEFATKHFCREMSWAIDKGFTKEMVWLIKHGLFREVIHGLNSFGEPFFSAMKAGYVTEAIFAVRAQPTQIFNLQWAIKAGAVKPLMNILLAHNGDVESNIVALKKRYRK